MTGYIETLQKLNAKSQESNTVGQGFRAKHLAPTKQRLKKHKLAGFDIETCDNNKTFVCCSLVARGQEPLFFTNKEDFLEEISKKRKWRDYWIFATNLGFDFFGTLFGNEYMKKFRLCWRGSDLLSAKAYYGNGGLHAERQYKSDRHSLQFIDTMNYLDFGVEKLGSKLLKLKKLDYKDIGKMPKTQEEWAEMKKYNIQDATITLEAGHYIQDSIIKLGGDMKITIASSAMKLFKNKYLDKKYIVHSKHILRNIFKAYYGGRTEVLKRGKFKNLYYHDINSMYPYVMKEKDFPNPNSLRIHEQGDINCIMNYEGVSHVAVHVPKTDYPLLPYRDTDNLLFPYGLFEGWYSNVELREALKRGAKLLAIYECYFYTETCRPFTNYVEDLYKKRMEFKADNNPMQEVTKLLLNSLYGKFAQKFDKVEVLNHIDACTLKELQSEHEQIGDFVRIVRDKEPSSFNINIWSVYVTAYARILLKSYIDIANPVYVDTDSVICDKFIEDSKLLGRLKIEHRIEQGIFVRPKMYAFVNDMCNPKDSNIVKCKGIKTKGMGYLDFYELLEHFTVKQQRFTKFKTALRSKGLLTPNEIIDIVKSYDIEDKKRSWKYKFNRDNSQDSEPRLVIDVKLLVPEMLDKLSEKEKDIIIDSGEYKNIEDASMKEYENEKQKSLKKLYESDLVDNKSLNFDSWRDECLD